MKVTHPYITSSQARLTMWFLSVELSERRDILLV